MTWGYTWFVFGWLFLWNPHINVIDILPDFIGWFAFAIGLARLSYLSEDAAFARKRAWILCGISLSQLLPMYCSLRGDSVFPLAAEPTMVLTYTFVYGLLYLWLGSSVIRKTLTVIETYGLLHNAKITTHGVTACKRMTIVFFLMRYACSIIPELVYLRSTEYLGNVIYGVVYDIRNFRPYLVIIFTILAILFGLIFLIMMLTYLRHVQKDGAFSRALSALADARHAEFYANQMNSKFAIAKAMLLCGAVFFGCVTLEYIDLLPDFLGVIFALIGLLLLRQFIKVKKSVFFVGALSLPVGLVYWIGRTLYARTTFTTLPYSFLRLCKYCFVPSHPDVTEALRSVLNAQWMLCLATAVKALVLIFFVRTLISTIETLDRISAKDGITVYDSMSRALMRDERLAYQRAHQDAFIWFCINAGLEVLAMTPPFAFSITPTYIVRVAMFIVFLWKFSSYLAKKQTMLRYHFNYNTEK